MNNHLSKPPCQCAHCCEATKQADAKRAETQELLSRIDDAIRDELRFVIAEVRRGS
jgi:hypothetical protein